MRFTLRSHKSVAYSSLRWHESRAVPGVRYATRRISLLRRIEMTSKVRDLLSQHEFLKAGDASDQLKAAMSELLVAKLYLEWGLVEIQNLSIEGEPAKTESLIENGPENLAQEIVSAIRSELELSEEERKNF